MKKRWNILIGAAATAGLLAVAPILYVETMCRAPIEGLSGPEHKSAIDYGSGKRFEARTWLTYPEWYIVYSADSYGAFLATGNRPSAFSYGHEIKGFWSGLCAVNQAVAGTGGEGAGSAKVMLYTIGVSFSAEMAIKGLYEKTIGRVTEWIGGWRSVDDAYAARIWQRYGSFMHETPWYEFPFGETFDGLWSLKEKDATFRHWERRLALSAEYGVKAGYAGLLGWASGATLGADERSLRFVAHGDAGAIEKVDQRLKVVKTLPGGRQLVEAPRYAQFTDLLGKLSRSDVSIEEIAGNDDIFVTMLLPNNVSDMQDGVPLMAVKLADRPGWRRAGVSVKVSRLLALMRETDAAGGTVEHVYDY